MTKNEAYNVGKRSQNMDVTTAVRSFYAACGIKSHEFLAPASMNDDYSYNYWCPDSDPDSNILDSFYEGYYNG